MRRPTIRGFVGTVAALAAAVALVAGVLTPGAPARAATAAELLKGFDPADIISDGVMWNSSTMSTKAIQTFLEGKQPNCQPGYTCLRTVTIDQQAMGANPMCGALPAAQDRTVAQVISAVAKACSVNPQVMLVMLQKEQTLVTGRKPYSGESVDLIYRKATGLGCPDTAPCDPAKYGLFNQLYGVAYWLVRYTGPAGTTGSGWTNYNWFPVGRPSGVLYNPSAACGAKTITIANKATASLYYYTPYQPNSAALAAGFGIGNSCSAYGNRNFYLYFTSWFGSTHYTVTGAIETYWKANGGAKGSLGEPIGNAVAVTAAGGGTTQSFAKGVVYSSAAGTVTVKGAMLAKYRALGGPGGVLGWPAKDVVSRKDNGGGTIQRFGAGAVYSSAVAGTWAVAGGMYDRYRDASFQAGPLAWPIADAVTLTGGASQAFQGGTVFAKTGAAARIVTGKVLTKYVQRGASTSTLGWPIGEEAAVSANGRKGVVQSFDRGQVIVLGAKTYTVTGSIWGNYRFHKGVAGDLGWPRSAAAQSAANGGGWSQRFDRGTIYWSATTDAHPLKGKELKLYNQRGGTKGSLGWPGTRKRDSAGIGGYVTPFTNGSIYSSSAGTIAVVGDIAKRYTAKGGPGGVLGWPNSTARTVDGATVQTFERGSISWTKDGGAVAKRS